MKTLDESKILLAPENETEYYKLTSRFVTEIQGSEDGIAGNSITKEDQDF